MQIRKRNIVQLTDFLKEKLTSLTNKKVKAEDALYKKFKKDLFVFFEISKWSDINVGQFNDVHAYIDCLSEDDIKTK